VPVVAGGQERVGCSSGIQGKTEETRGESFTWDRFAKKIRVTRKLLPEKSNPMPVETKRHPDGIVTEVIATNRVSEAKKYATLEEFYANGPTLHLLWDIPQSDIETASPDTLREFVRRGTLLGNQREGGRTALIATEDLHHGLGKMSENFFELESPAFTFRVFRSRTEATSWLMTGNRLPPQS
jgi:hypothetical protein